MKDKNKIELLNALLKAGGHDRSITIKNQDPHVGIGSVTVQVDLSYSQEVEIDLGDIFRNANKKENFTLIVGFWEGSKTNIVEEVLGEIQDPYDDDKSLIFKQKDGSLIIDAKIAIYDLQEEIEIDFPEDREYDTLAGFILHSLGDIPEIGEEINYQTYKIKVKSIDGNRIDKIHLIKV